MTGVSGITTTTTVEVTDFYSLGWWLAEQTNDDQVEFLHGLAQHFRDGFVVTSSEEPAPITPGDMQLAYIADELHKRPVVQSLVIGFAENLDEWLRKAGRS